MSKPTLDELKARVNAIARRPRARHPDAAYPFPPAQSAREWVAVEVGRLAGVPPEHVRPEMTLHDLGLDELARIELALCLEELMDLAEHVDLSGCITVRDAVGSVMRTKLRARP